MIRTDRRVRPLAHIAHRAALLCFLVAGTACGDAALDEPADVGAHGAIVLVELAHADDPTRVLARWREGSGWENEAGTAIDELPASVGTAAGSLALMEAGGPPSRLTVRMVDTEGVVLPMSTLEEDTALGERVCSEFSARYVVEPPASPPFAWPAVPHPESTRARPPHLFVAPTPDVLVPAFRCDEVAIHPTSSGIAPIRFVLWHVDHSDDFTDPIRVRVLPPT